MNWRKSYSWSAPLTSIRTLSLAMAIVIAVMLPWQPAAASDAREDFGSLLVRAQESDGQHLYLYAGTGAGGFDGPRHLSNGWGRYNALVGVGDVTGDGVGDLAARAQESDGQHLYLYAGTGAGGLDGPRHLSNGWGRYNAIVGMPSSRPQRGQRQLPSQLLLSNKGISFIEEFEDFRARVYEDAGKNCAIGYGTLIHRGQCTPTDAVQWGTISEAQAETLLIDDAENLSKSLRSLIPSTPLYQYEWDALVSWAYNLGTGSFRGTGLDRALSSTPPSYGSVPTELLKWVYSGGRRLCGLYRRRLDEGQIFSNGDYAVNRNAVCPSGYERGSILARSSGRGLVRAR